MNPISFMTANYVAREVNFHMTDWSHGQDAVMAYFQPIETYAERFNKLLDDICELGFDTIDLWLPHLHPEWATDAHIAIAKTALAGHGLKVASLAGWFGGTPAEFERCCKVAQALGTRVLGGMTALVGEGRAEMVDLMERYDTLMAIENHPEKTPAEVLAQIGDTGRGRIGTCIDTGIWASHGYDPLKAVVELWPHIFHVHAKQVRVFGGHETCRFDQGAIPMKQVVKQLIDLGYTGDFSVEHEPRDFDPSADAAASAVLLRGWLEEFQG